MGQALSVRVVAGPQVLRSLGMALAPLCLFLGSVSNESILYGFV